MLFHGLKSVKVSDALSYAITLYAWLPTKFVTGSTVPLVPPETAILFARALIRTCLSLSLIQPASQDQ